jgi:DNA (cytosine-5)-methyltransferase 1
VIGSLCSGYGGLDLAAGAVFGQPVAWHCEIEDAPSRVLEAHWPGVPNLRDLTEVDWDTVEPVDILTAGYPCQPFSHAGRRKGADDERHLWPFVAEAVRRIRPRLVVLENVAGHRSLGFDVVLGDLAALRYDTRWTSLRAAHVGAPHERERVFILATSIAHSGGRRWRAEADRRERANGGGPRGSAPGPGASLAADTDRDGLESVGRVDRRGHPHTAWDATERAAAADTGREHLRQQPVTEPGRCHTAESRNARAVAWGAYEPAIRRWERALGRAAPPPTKLGPRGGQRLSPRFVEWMMGLPDGWVTDVSGLSRSDQLRMLGNGVVPQQAEAALRALTTAAAA